ncbi:MAG: protein translocase subunit SecD [Planctomycetes bacterium]|nr:protein translocase subunit SecD [Planctomycetota bacterium]
MNAKNLPIKFGLLALLVLMSIWSLFANKVQLGIDLRGGHSLVFEIRTGEAEIARLSGELAKKEALLAGATDPGLQEQLKTQIAGIKDTIAALEQERGNLGDLQERMIALLKARIDPQGLSSLDWRPMHPNRIEIRMPAGRKESLQAKLAYDRELEKLDAGNIEPYRLEQISSEKDPQVRQAMVAELSGGDQRRADLFAQYVQAVDRKAAITAGIEEIRVALAAVPTSTAAPTADQIALADKLESQLAELDVTNSQVSDIRRALLGTNLHRSAIDSVFQSYLTSREAAGIKSSQELEARRQRFNDGLAGLMEKHPTRKEQLEVLVARYKEWAESRRQLDDPSDLIRMIRNAGVLEFRIAPLLATAPGHVGSGFISAQRANQYIEILKNPEEGPEALRRRNDEYLWMPIRAGSDKYTGMITAETGGQKYLLVHNRPAHTMLQNRSDRRWALDRAGVTNDDSGRWAVSFTFNDAGARLFGNMTASHHGQQMAVLLDDEVYSAPTIQATITTSGIITGSFTIDDAKHLARTLEAGSLPAKLNPEPVSMNTFGASLGEENLRQAIRAGIYGAIVVVAFMLVYYLLSGAIANVALALNVLLVLGAMSMLNAVFTLPGIAGVILTIGMAVDANVLIYERLREEQQKGLSIRMAIKNAYERAFSAIFDSNLTTLITCVVLGWVTTEEVRGFAITLGLGVVFNIFSAVYVTRWIFQALLESKLVTRPLHMLKVIGVPNVNWVSKRYYFWAVSAAFVAMGIGSLVWQGKDVLGIEFSSGTQAIMTFRDDALIDGQLPDDALVRQRFTEKAQAHQRLAATARVEKIDTGRVANFVRDHDANGDAKVTLAEWENSGLDREYFVLLQQRVGADELTSNNLLGKLPAKSYQVSTTETQVPLIQSVAAEAFGQALEKRQPLSFELIKSTSEWRLGMPLDESGATRVTADMSAKAPAEYRKEFVNREGGVLHVIRLGEHGAALSDVVQRLRDTRFQPDFASVRLNDTDVIPLEPVGKNMYRQFAVLSSPADPTVSDSEKAWQEFAQSELNLLSSAMMRQEAMDATNFDAAIAGQASQSAIVAMVLSWILIIVYLWLRFGSARWGFAAVVCLIHDILIVVGMVAASNWLANTSVGRMLLIQPFKIDLPMIAAFLTIIGYSVNDTIVVFDRLRENRGKLQTVTPEAINLSVNQTLSRTVLTGTTTLMVVLVMYIAGGQGIHAFNYALLIGMLFGTYSSIAIASPLLLGVRRMMLPVNVSPVRQETTKV